MSQLTWNTKLKAVIPTTDAQVRASSTVTVRITDTLTTNNENELFVTKQVYESFDSCLNDAVTEVAEALSIAQLARGQPKPKKACKEDLRLIVFACFNARRGKQKSTVIKCLLDTGASGSFISTKHSKNLKLRKAKKPEVIWNTPGGTLLTTETCTCVFALPEFHRDRAIQWDMYLAKDLGAFDMIIGRDILSDLGVKFDFTKHTMEWDGATIAMRAGEVEHPQVYFTEEPEAVHEAAERLKDILDAKYEKADLDQVVEENTHLSHNQKHKLHHLLTKFNDLFDGTLGKWNMGCMTSNYVLTLHHTMPNHILFPTLDLKP